VDRDGDADACIRTRQFLEHEDVRQEVGTGPAVLLGHADSHQTELGDLAEELAREAVIAIPLRGVGLDLLRAELARQRLDLALLRIQLEVQAKAPGIRRGCKTSRA
jgi:hypothetical protein